MVADLPANDEARAAPRSAGVARTHEAADAARAELRAGLDELSVGLGVDRGWSGAMGEIVEQLQLSQLAAGEAAHARRLAQLVLARPFDGAAALAAARAGLAALAELRVQLRALRAAFGAASREREPTPMLRHFLLCAGAHVAADVLHFVQGHMVYRDFAPEPRLSPEPLCVKDLLHATCRAREASLHALVRSLGHAPALEGGAGSESALLGGAPDEGQLLGSRFVDSIWALYESNVERVLGDAEAGLRGAHAVRESLVRLAQEGAAAGGGGKGKENSQQVGLACAVALADEAIFSAEVHAERCAERLRARGGHDLRPFSKHIGAHGCVLQASHRAFKQLAALLSALDGGGPGACPPRVRKRLYEEDEEDARSAEGETATPPTALAPPSPRAKAIRDRNAHGAPAAPQPSALTRVLGGAAAIFRRKPAASPAAAVVESAVSYAFESAGRDDGGARGRVVECALAVPADDGQLQLRIKNAPGAPPLSPLFLKVEHLVRAEAVGGDLKRRWESDGFAELRTHGYELLDEPAICAGETRLLAVRWPASRSHHISIVFAARDE